MFEQGVHVFFSSVAADVKGRPGRFPEPGKFAQYGVKNVEFGDADALDAVLCGYAGDMPELGVNVTGWRYGKGYPQPLGSVQG